jgi:saccharopine dehydrogenase (NAD+, L-lysine-forming)
MDEAGLDQPQGCLKIVVKGRKNGEANSYVFSMSSWGQGMGEGTGIPAQIVPTGACRGAKPQATSYQP